MSTRKPVKRSDFAVFQSDTRFRGRLKFQSPLQILGSFEGEISGEALLEIGEGASVKAVVRTTHLVLYGELKGDVYASEKVELRTGARLYGNIRSPKLEIDDGVIFEGQCEMKTDKTA